MLALDQPWLTGNQRFRDSSFETRFDTRIDRVPQLMINDLSAFSEPFEVLNLKSNC